MKINFKENEITKAGVEGRIEAVKMKANKTWQEQYQREKTVRRTAKLILQMSSEVHSLR